MWERINELFDKILAMISQSNILRNIGANFLFKGASIALSFIYVPIALEYMGDFRYGVWATISSIVMWISLADIGIGNGLRNKLTEALAHNDVAKAQGLISTAYIVMLCVCIFLWLLYISISTRLNLAELLGIGIPNDDVNSALTVTVTFVLINFWLGLSSQILYAMQKPALITFTNTVGQALNVLFLLASSYMLPVSLPVVSILLGMSSLITQVGLSAYIYHKYSYLVPKKVIFQKKFIHDIVSIGALLFFGQLTAMILNSSDNILISKLFSPEEVTPYTTAYKFFQIIIMIDGLIIMPMWSAFTLKKEKHEYEWIDKSLKKMNQVSAVLSVLVIGLIFVIPPFSDVWLHHHLNYDVDMLIVMAIYTIAYNFSCNYSALLCGIGELRIFLLSSIISAISNIPLSIFFSVYYAMGVTGIIVGTLVSMVPFFILVPIDAVVWIKKQKANK